MTVNDSDEMAAISNIRKAQAKWKRIFPVLIKEGAKPKMITPFYKAVVLSSLLYGSETWTITRKMYQIIESFHRTAIRRMANLPIKYDKKSDKWIYTSIEKAYRKVKMQPIYEYLYSRRKYIMPFAEQLETYNNMATKGKQSSKII